MGKEGKEEGGAGEEDERRLQMSGDMGGEVDKPNERAHEVSRMMWTAM